MKHAASYSAVPRMLAIVTLVGLFVGCSSSDPQPVATAPPRDVKASPAVTAPVAEMTTAGSDTDPKARPESKADAESENATPEVVDAVADTPKTVPGKKGRDPIYNPAADARAEVQAAVSRAAYDHKRVLVKFGGNWCGWCFKLHDLFHANQEIAALLRSEYEVVLVDVNSNRELLKEYDPNGKHGYPWLTVLDESGKVLCNQNTGSLEDGPKHDPEKVHAFLAKWQTERVDAEQALAAGLEKARAENKRLLVHIGAPWCGWCHVLDRYLRDQGELIGVDYIDLKIDQDRMTNGKALASKLRSGADSGGIPWMAILDAEGKTLVTSDGPRGNIGYPGEASEIEHFIAMLNQTRQRLSDDQVSALERPLQEFAAKRQAAAKQR